jgi:pimeloyl-ACP methyl ester carboxylesterase
MYTNPFEHQSGTITIPEVKAAGFVERQFDTGKIKLNYVIGPNNGPALVLIPAQMGTWESYQKVLVPLSKQFQVFAIDVRGHGKSSWTPGDYSWKSIGADMKAFLAGVVKQPAIISGNSSGGIIALWCAANLPDQVRGIILEDAPVFSVEMPRFKAKDKFVYNGLKHAAEVLGDLEHRDLANYLRDQEMPVSESRSKRMPDWFVDFLSRKIKEAQTAHPDQPVNLDMWYLPSSLTLLFKSLSMFDPDFSRAFVDGRFYEGIDHEAALKKVRCPLLVLHANWHRYPKHGLVGAMDDADAARIQALVPQAQYKKIPANHVIHAFKPKAFIKAVEEFAETIN